jgi:Zn-dependent M28 family amino/carboxypeptidase
VTGDEPPVPADVARASALLMPPPTSGAFDPALDQARLPVSLAPGRPWRIALGSAAFARVNDLPPGTNVRVDAETQPGSTCNVIAKLPGADPARAGEVLVLGAHIDHVGPRAEGADRIHNGADDNASGVTAVLELAEALSGGPRPARTIIFTFFGSEETGGEGARHFVDHPPVPLERIVANLQFEMIGRPDPTLPGHTVWLSGYERSTLGPALAEHGAPLVADPRPDQDFFRRSDNFRFARRGVVAHAVSSFGLHRDYHTPADDVSRIDFTHMTRAVQSLVAPLRWLANATFRPEWREGMRPPPADDGR